MRPTFICLILSIALHLLGVGWALVLMTTAPKFAVETGKDSVEIDLQAAGPEPVAAVVPPLPKPEPPRPDPVPPAPPEAEPVLAAPTPAPPPAEPSAEKIPAPASVVLQVAEPTVKKRSSIGHHPGRDAVTARSSAGATLASKPAYLRNPPPVYPEEARLQKQEGVVVLDVSVDAEGVPAHLVVSDSSHYPLLDQAAIKAVSHWRFRPASLGGFNVESHALVPVRFELEAR